MFYRFASDRTERIEYPDFLFAEIGRRSGIPRTGHMQVNLIERGRICIVYGFVVLVLPDIVTRSELIGEAIRPKGLSVNRKTNLVFRTYVLHAGKGFLGYVALGRLPIYCA